MSGARGDWRRAGARALLLGAMALLAGACATAAPDQPAAEGSPPPRTARTAPAPPPRVEPLPDAFRSDDFIVTFARAGDTAQTLAARHLGDAGKSWMIADYMGKDTFAAGEEVIVPVRPWNPAGVEANGYQLVPILCYHNLDRQAKGRAPRLRLHTQPHTTE